MTVYTLDPLQDPRWKSFTDSHPEASVFHSCGWLRALQRTYHYRAVVFTTTPPGEPLTNGIVGCEIDSWLTGRRLVSLPFSDHCQPLVSDPGDWASLVGFLKLERERAGWRYLELRPLLLNLPGARGPVRGFSENPFYVHWLDLSDDLERIFQTFHKSCVQRRIRRAEKEGLDYEEGCGQDQLERFYGLLVQTRRRQGLPPPSLAWLESLRECLGSQLRIHLVSRHAHPIAGMITLICKQTVVYKYGASLADFNHLGGVPLVFWKAIQQAQELGARWFDFGRTEISNRGLLTFKDRWGTRRLPVSYFRSPSGICSWSGAPLKAAGRLVPSLPRWLLVRVGTLLYPHVG